MLIAPDFLDNPLRLDRCAKFLVILDFINHSVKVGHADNKELSNALLGDGFGCVL